MSTVQTNEAPGQWLIIGYGNTLRGDDAVGQRVAEEIDRLNLAGVQAIARHQLTPELAEPVSKAHSVIFVDAAVDVDGADVRVSAAGPAAERQVMAHTTSPGGLLELARVIFGRCPPAWLVRIPVAELGIGEHLSPQAQRGLAEAVRRVRNLLKA